MIKNYYQILGLDINATKKEIKKAYRLYATKYHPDKQNGDKFFEERFIEIQEAYETLSNDVKRARYDSKFKASNNNLKQEKWEKQRRQEEEQRKKREQELRRKQREEQKRKREEELLKKREEELRKKREEEKKFEEERRNNERKRNKIFYTSNKILVNGLYINSEGKIYLLEDYNLAVIRKDDNSSFIFLGIVLIILGIVTFAFFIGLFLLIIGIFALFYKEYYVVLINDKEYGDIPLIKGRKRKMRKISKKINQAFKMK